MSVDAFGLLMEICQVIKRHCSLGKVGVRIVGWCLFADEGMHHKLYRHVWSLIMRKDQKAMMSLPCSHMRKLCANDACMFRHVSLHDHFLACRWHCCQAPAGWGWHRSYDGDRHSLRARYISVWLFEMWLYMSLTMVHQLISRTVWRNVDAVKKSLCVSECGTTNGLTQCVKNHLLPWEKIFASKECAVASAVRCCQVFSAWR